MYDRAERPGQTGRAILLYACDGDACRGDEGFVHEASHAISVEVDAPEASSVWLTSSDERVFSVSDNLATFNPCTRHITALATLHAAAPGEAFLRVHDASGEIDRIAISIDVEASILLRVTQREAFAFEAPSGAVQTQPGEAWLILPELYDARSRLLVGRVPLTWTVIAPALATLVERPADAEDEAASSLTKLSGLTALHITSPGQAQLLVQSRHGAQALLTFEIGAPTSANP